MKISSKKQILSSFEKKGYVFSMHQVEEVGDHAAEDAIWNYRDLPHLDHVHTKIDFHPTFISEHVVIGLMNQTVLNTGITLPFLTHTYVTDPNTNLQVCTMFGMTFIIEVRCESAGKDKAKVTSTYHIGSKPYLKFLHKLFIRMFTKNHHFLMQGDVPMRSRRTQLRSWNYSFLGGDPYFTFLTSNDIEKNNLVLPTNGGKPDEAEIKIPESLTTKGEFLYGRDDHFGLQVIQKDDEVLIFPRLCPHEGASLDGDRFIRDDPTQRKCASKKSGHIVCSWHGRRFQPLATFKLNDSGEQQWQTEFHDLSFLNGTLRIQPR